MAALLDREDIKKMIDGLPEGATLEDLAYQIYVRQAIEAGRADFGAGRFNTRREVFAKYYMPKRTI